jgi:glycosyltransferase involved in cell wall biosynthesis
MGGSATRAYNVAKGLKMNECEVTVLSAVPHYPTGNISNEYRWKPVIIENMDGFKLIRIFVPPIASEGLTKRLILFIIFIVSSLFALPLIKKIDIVWAANPTILSIFPAKFYGFINRVPVALNVDDLWPDYLSDLEMMKKGSIIMKIASFVAKLAYTTADLITPISPGYVRIIHEKYGVNQEKIKIVRSGVDLSKFKINYASGHSRKEKFKILYSGAFSLAYDFDQVINAAKQLEDKKDIEIILQGGGELAKHIIEKIRGLQLVNVGVINKIVSREEVAMLLQNADVLILPLKDFGAPYLGISSKLYEYQAMAKPIICIADGQPADYIKETCSGIIVKPGNYDELVKAILYLKDNPSDARKMGLSGRDYVVDNMSIEQIGFKMKKMLNSQLIT